jgi:hypothetical protein
MVPSDTNDLGIQESNPAVAFGRFFSLAGREPRDIHHDGPEQCADLGRGDPHAGRGIQGVRQVG